MALSPEQIEERRLGIGGSDAAGIAGLDPFTSPLKIYKQKIGAAANDDDVTVDDPRYWGNLLEEPIANAWAQETHNQIQRRTVARVSKEFPFLRANIDRWVIGEKAGVEIKNRGWFRAKEYGPSDTDQVLESDVMQCTHYMIVYGVDRWHMGILLGGNDFRHYTIHRDQKLVDAYLELANNFWHNHVVKQDPPLPITYEEAVNAWNAKAGTVVTATPEIMNVIENLRSTKTVIKDLENLEGDLKLRIANFMQEKTTLAERTEIVDVAGIPLITWNEQTSKRISPEKVRAALEPALVEELSNRTTTRVMRLK